MSQQQEEKVPESWIAPWFYIFNLFSHGQVLCTLGGPENLQTAKKYYAFTINLTGGKNTRALFGICLVSLFSLSLSRYNISKAYVL